MITLDLIQGSQEWRAKRQECYTASEASAMMGASKYQTRDQLLAAKSTGIVEEIDGAKQRLFQRGHDAEAINRPAVEALIGQELYPVTGFSEIEGLPLLASFDGITMDETIIFEHKLSSQNLIASIKNGELEPHYYWQLEQQLLVSGAEKAIFVCGDETGIAATIEYVPVPGRKEQLIAGWKLFDKDLESYAHQEVAQKVEGKTIKELPALVVEISGEVKSSNLAIYQDYALSFIASVNKNLQTDQDFADADNVVKFCERVEKELVVAKKQVLAQAISVNEVLNTIDYISEEHRKTRLLLSKLIESEKESRKREIIQFATTEFKAFMVERENKLPLEPHKILMPKITPDFAGAGKGKRTLDTYRSAVNDALAKAKIDATIVLQKILLNIAQLNKLAVNHQFLFNDAQSLIDKDADAFAAIVKMRIADYDKAIEEEAKREAEAAKAAAQAAAEQAPVAVISSVQPAAPANDERPQSGGSAFSRIPTRSNAIPKSLPTSEQVIDAVAIHFNMQSVDAERLLIDLFRSQ